MRTATKLLSNIKGYTLLEVLLGILILSIAGVLLTQSSVTALRAVSNAKAVAKHHRDELPRHLAQLQQLNCAQPTSRGEERLTTCTSQLTNAPVLNTLTLLSD
jgi:prepilin-type N-terminal cleavage/methylation domain-containing protein